MSQQVELIIETSKTKFDYTIYTKLLGYLPLTLLHVIRIFFEDMLSEFLVLYTETVNIYT